MSIIDDSEEIKKVLEAIDRKNKSDSKEKEIRDNLRNVYDFSDDDEMDCPSPMFQVKVKSITGYTKPCCKSMCNLKVWPSLILQKIYGFVANLSKQQIKQSLLDHLYGQRIIDGRVDCIVIMGHCFCKKGFSFLSGVSAYLVDEVFKAFNIGQVSFIHGNEIGLREGEACINFTAWLTNFAKNYGNYAPDEETLVISSCYSLKDIFNIYRAECAGPHVSKSYFYKLFDYKFGPKRIDKTLPHIRISSYSTHSQCDECLLLDKFHRSCKTEGEFAYVRSLKERHRLNYAKARLAIEEHRHKSINDPDSALFIQIDDMENKVSFVFMRLMSPLIMNTLQKLLSPRAPAIGKSASGMIKLPTRLTGVIVWSGRYPQNRKIWMLMNHDQFEQSGSKVVSILYDIILAVHKDFGVLPKNLHINLDNCWR